MYSRWTSPHVRRLFVSISQRFPQGVQLSQLHQPSRNVNYRKEIGALDSFVGHLTALLVHLRQVHPLKAPSAVRYNIFITYESKA